MRSWSETWVAIMLSVHVSPKAKSVEGSSVKLDGPPETAAVCTPLVEQLRLNQGSVTFTGSLKFTVTLLLRETSVASFAGTVLATLGASSIVEQTLKVDAVLRGAGAPAVKSVALLSVSWQPFQARWMDVVADGAGATAPS